MEKAKRIVKILLGIPLTIIAFIFIGKILIDSWPQIQEQLFKANPLLLTIGIFFMLGFFLIRSIVWMRVLNFFAKNDKSSTECIHHYALAETKRYIPGNIFSFISRIQKFHGKSYSKKTIFQAIIIETLIVIVAAFTVTLPAIYSYLTRNDLLTSALFLIMFIILIFLFLFFTFKKATKEFIGAKIKKLLPAHDFFSYLNVILGSVISWVFFGLGNYFLAAAIFPVDPNSIIIFSSFFVLSWMVGYLSFVVPMGLGVREAAVIYFLSPFIPLFAGTAISIFTRIFFVVSEVMFLVLTWIFYNFPKNIKKKVNFKPIYLVAIFAFFYISYFIYFTTTRHFNFLSGRFDLGNMEQTIWNTINGNIFTLSNYEQLGEFSRLAIHADFILILIAPIYAVLQTPITLLVIQTLIIGLGGFFVYLIAKKIIKSEKIAVLLSLGYYLNFFVQEQNIFDFHSVSLATTFLLGAFYYLLEKKHKIFSLFLILAVLTKENVYLVSAIFGGFLFIKRSKFYGSILFFLSIIIFLFLMIVAIPNARVGEHFALEYLSYLGNSPIEVIFSPVLRPIAFFGQLLSLDTFTYIYKVFLPVGFISFLSPFYLIFMLPDFLINVMSDNPNLRSIQYHYGALLVPFVYISAIYAIKKFVNLLKNKRLSINIIFYYLLFFIIFSTYQYSPLPGTKNADTAPFKDVKNRSEIYELLSKIPDNASVSATNSVAAHLSQRQEIYVVPVGIEVVEYAVFYKEKLEYARNLLEYDTEFTTVAETQDLIILKRVNSPDRAYKP